MRVALALADVEGLAVELVDLEVEELGEEAVDRHFEVLGRLFCVTLHEFRKTYKLVLPVLNVPRNYPGHFLHQTRPLVLLDQLLSLDIFYFAYYQVVDLHKFVENGAVF